MPSAPVAEAGLEQTASSSRNATASQKRAAESGAVESEPTQFDAELLQWFAGCPLPLSQASRAAIASLIWKHSR